MAVELQQGHFTGEWLTMCIQLLEALFYLHEEVHILHNDIKTKVAKSVCSDPCAEYQVVLIDFGKATKISEGKRYTLSGAEREEYIRKFPHIAPEIVKGETKQNIYSDMYSFGKVLFQIISHGCMNGLDVKKKKLAKFAEKCLLPDNLSRPCAHDGLDILKTLLP